MKKLLYILFSLFIALAIVELLLRFSGKLQTYSEQNFNEYQSAYSAEGLDHLFVWPANDVVNPSQTEFDYTYYTNHWGLVFNQDLDTCNRENTYIFFGDSFVFGVGAPQDSSLPVLLGQKLNASIINAGIPGSDPFFQEKLVDSLFAPLGFRQYLFMVNFSDIYDFVIRGGKERFVANQTLKYRQAPWIETPYKYSYVVRAIVHGICRMDFSLLSPKELQILKIEAVTAYTNLFSSLAQKYSIQVVLMPYPRQFAKNNTSLDAVINYESILALGEALETNGVQVFDLNPSVSNVLNESNYTEYSWPIDGHYKAKGYDLLAQILANSVSIAEQ